MERVTKGSLAANQRRQRSRGVALIVTLTLLALLSAASLAMVLSVSSDTLINGYYRNYRGSFYAADSGANIVIQTIQNAIQSSALAAPAQPFSGTTIPTAVTTSYAPYQAGFYTIGDTGSWNSQFELVANPGGVPVVGTPMFTGTPTALPTQWTYSFPYTVTVQGRSQGGESEQITTTGAITYTSGSTTTVSGAAPSFAKWGAFITNFPSPGNGCGANQGGGPLVPGTMSGPFFTDTQWNLGNFSSPGYTFTGTLGQHGANLDFIASNGNCTPATTAPSGFNQPQFQGGLLLNQNSIVAPTNNYSQEQAVLDGKGAPPCTATPCAAATAPTQATMNALLQTVSGSAYPTSGTPSSGVYFPSFTSGTGPGHVTCSTANPCFGSNPGAGGDGYGGGFLVSGDASVTMAATTTGGNPTQTYTITQGSTTTTIVVNNSAGTTTVAQGSTSQTYQGTPSQVDPTTGQPMAPASGNGAGGDLENPTLIYVNGSISGMSGTVQNNNGVTVTASGNVSITGDITYASQPVSIPSDTLNTGTNAGVLGIYTNGNIDLYPNSSGSNAGNLTVNASLAAIGGASNTAGFATPGDSIGTWQIVGGRAEDQAHPVSIRAGNTYYDQRFGNNFGPPWFPTSIPQPGDATIVTLTPSSTVIRTSWVENRP